ncbi:MAG: EamA family transporter [Actinotalea sp.]|nr:EamA family transporter [Actinotalea sp.]
MTRSGALDRVPAPAIFVVSGLTLYLGAALAVGLFAVLPAATVAWLRIVVAAAVLVAWSRPWRRRWTRRDLAVATAFGACLAAMNITFYVAIEHLPLGTAVAIEFVGPVVVAAVTGSGWRERLGIVLAAAGVVLLAGVTLSVGGPGAAVGLVAILLAATFWAGYIVLGRRVAIAGEGMSGLAVAMAAGGLLSAPFLAVPAAPVLTSWTLAAAVVGVALLSSVVPYVLDQVVMRRVGPALFAILLALLPATAAVVGAVVLQQWLTAWEVVGLVLVSGAIALASARRRPALPEPAVTP